MAVDDGYDLAQWPDGQPVTPWADPWHDVLVDTQEVMSWPSP